MIFVPNSQIEGAARPQIVLEVPESMIDGLEAGCYIVGGMDKLDIRWAKPENIESRQYVCGYCGSTVGPNQGYLSLNQLGQRTKLQIHICTMCQGPTFFDQSGKQYPSPVFGSPVISVPTPIRELYEEARACMSGNAPTAAAMCCRKILMSIAVEKGAQKNGTFASYVDFLVTKGYINPDYKEWIDHIRNVGNDATHKIDIISPDEAKKVMRFTEMLLRQIYEYAEEMKAESKTASELPK